MVARDKRFEMLKRKYSIAVSNKWTSLFDSDSVSIEPQIENLDASAHINGLVNAFSSNATETRQTHSLLQEFISIFEKYPDEELHQMLQFDCACYLASV